MNQTEAIVLRLHAWSETSLVGSLYTRDYGKIGVVAKGARRPKSPFEAALDLLSVCRIVFIAKSGDALNLLTEAKLVRRFRNTDGSLLRLYCAYYVVEMLEQFTQPGEQPPEIYDLASDTLMCLERSDLEVRAIVLRFEMQMLRLAGMLPALRRCVGCSREVDSNDWLVFGVAAGGVLCSSCSQGQKLLIKIPLEVRDYVETFGQSQWQSMPMNYYIQQGRATIRAMMTKTITVMLDRRMRLHPYLEELGR